MAGGYGSKSVTVLSAERLLGRATYLHGMALQQLASGSRLVNPSSDPAALAVLQNLRSDIRVAHVAVRNANDGLSAVRIADDAYGSINNILQRIAELAEQGASGTYSMAQRSLLNQEVQLLGSEIERIAKTTKFNGQLLIDAHQLPINLQVGLDGKATSVLQVSPTDGTLSGLRLADDDSSQMKYKTVGSTIPDAQNQSQTLLEATMRAMEIVGQNRGQLGAMESRLTSAINTLSTARENFEAAASRINDVDVAEVGGTALRQQILQQSAAAVLAHAQMDPQRVLQLLLPK